MFDVEVDNFNSINSIGEKEGRDLGEMSWSTPCVFSR